MTRKRGQWGSVRSSFLRKERKNSNKRTKRHCKRLLQSQETKKKEKTAKWVTRLMQRNLKQRKLLSLKGFTSRKTHLKRLVQSRRTKRRTIEQRRINARNWVKTSRKQL